MSNIGVPTRVLRQGDQGEDVERLHNYLTRFGYFPNPSMTGRLVGLASVARVASAPTNTAIFDAQTELAVRAFQRMQGLPEDGLLNAETLALMGKPRCGFPDLARASNFVAWGAKWPGQTLKYRYENVTAGVSATEAKAAIRASFERWAAVIPMDFEEGAETPEIRIGWYRGEHGDGNPFDGAGAVLAHAFFPTPDNGELAGDMHFDGAETWSTNWPPSGFDLQAVSLHELGHVLGLDHSHDRNAVMYAYYDRGNPRRELTSDDIEGVQSLYGSNQGSGHASTILWHTAQERISLWGVDAQDRRVSFKEHGPFSGWAPVNCAQDKVLWRHADGRISLWTVNSVGDQVRFKEYGPFPGWTALHYSDGRILWQTESGRISLWRVDGDGNRVNFKEHGPFGDWRPVSCSQDKVLWRHPDGRISLWTVDAEGERVRFKEHGPFPGWTALHYSDGRILWQTEDGRISLWRVDGDDNRVNFKEHGPFGDWRPVSCSQDKVLWRHPDGRISLWTVDSEGARVHFKEHGPFPGWVVMNNSGL